MCKISLLVNITHYKRFKNYVYIIYILCHITLNQLHKNLVSVGLIDPFVPCFLNYGQILPLK